MRILMLIIILAITVQVQAKSNLDSLKAQITKNNKHLSKEYVSELSKLLIKYEKKYKLDAKLMAAVFMQESAYDVKAINRECGYHIEEPMWHDTETCIARDIGISQINVKTIKSYKFDVKKLHTNLEYSVEAGYIVMEWFQSKYKASEPDTWWCRYNTGTAKYNKIKTNCQIYVKRVKRWK